MRAIQKPAVLAAAFVALFAGAARAQETVVAKVPFSFVVRGEQFPAGRYEVLTNGDGVVSIRGTDNKSVIVAIAMPADGRDPLGDHPSLVFTRYENTYRLSQIWEDSVDGWAVLGVNAPPQVGRAFAPSDASTYALAANWK